MGFEKTRQTRVNDLDLNVEEFVHDSGLRHIHLQRKDSELGFSIGFRTPPDSANGRAHVFEHLSLCGSRNYPVRDPFFAMTRRSLASFMNAFTYPDRTVYPFNTPNRKDFDNLLGIYLDATFFPNLRELDFRQEGWRLEVQENEDGDKTLEIQGVVYNEMKGAYGNPMRAQQQGLQGAIRPGTSYAVDSGGDPEAIPNLTHAELVRFHQEHYHPSRAVVVTYGDIDPADIQDKIESLVLSQIKTPALPPLPFEVPLIPGTPVTVPVAFQGSGEGDDHAVYLSWLRHPITDIDNVLLDRFMTTALFLGSSSPLVQKLEGLGYGRPADRANFEDYLVNSALHLGISGLTEDQTGTAVEDLRRVLAEVAEEGLPEEQLQSAIRQLELRLRETESDDPFGLELSLEVLTQALFGGDVAGVIDADLRLENLRPHLTQDGVRQWAASLLATPATRIVMVPENDWQSRRNEAEQAHIGAIAAGLSDNDWARIRKEQEAVHENQLQPSDLSVLPSMTVGDIAPTPQPLAEVSSIAIDGAAFHQHIHADSRGIGEFSLLLDASSLTVEDWPWAALWAQMVTRMGAGTLDWQAHAHQLSEEGQDIHAGLAPLGSIHHPEDLRLLLAIEGKTLEAHADRLGQGLVRLLQDSVWDDPARLGFLVQRLAQKIQADPSGTIPVDAGRGITATGDFKALVSGPLALNFWTGLPALLEASPGEVIARLQGISRKLQSMPLQVHTIGGPAMASAGNTLARGLGHHPAFNPTQRSVAAYSRQTPEFFQRGWSVSQPVGRMFQVFEAPPRTDADFATFQVLSAVMGAGFLHTAVREKGGAYGANASTGGAIVLSSYRDPRVRGTFDDFGRAIDWAQSGQFDARMVSEGIVSTFQSIDAPQAPRAKASQAWECQAIGIDDTLRAETRRRLLDLTHADLQAAARKWFSAPSARLAVVPESRLQEAEVLGLEVTPINGVKTKGPRLR
jgi:Zn-dependent M16 (insulinase) family peptidase